MIADWCYNPNGKPENTRSYDEIPKEERDNNGWWYLDGELESYVCNDKAYVTNCQSGGFAIETINWSSISGSQVKTIKDPMIRTEMYFNGIANVEIEGIDKPCIGFFWTSEEQDVFWEGLPYPIWKQRGLVCFADDKLAIEYAKKKYEEKSMFL